MLGLVPKTNGVTKGAQSVPAPLMRYHWPLDRLIERFDEVPWGHRDGHIANACMRLEVIEEPERVLIRAEVPGIDTADLDIQLADDTLVLSGEKRKEPEVENSERHYSERIFGVFKRTIQLPCPVEADGVEAEYRNGIVYLTLAKADAVRPKRIEIKQA